MRMIMILNLLMSSTIREFTKALRGFLLSLGIMIFSIILPTASIAASNPANDSTQIQISVIPSVDRGVIIDTDTVNLNLGTVDMHASTQTVSPATVTIQGNVTNTELSLSAQITGGWNFDDNVSASTETDKLGVWVLFRSSSEVTTPAKGGSLFDDTDDALESANQNFGPVRVGFNGGDTGNDDRFEDGTTNMDSLFPGDKRTMWFYFQTPPVTSVTAEQEIQFTISTTQGP